MSALTAVPRPFVSPAHRWFDRHVAELTSRAQLFVRRLPRTERQDVVAEILAMTLKYVLRAGRRGKLLALTPFTLISFFGRAYAAGRRVVDEVRSQMDSAWAQLGPRECDELSRLFEQLYGFHEEELAHSPTTHV